MNNAAGNSEWYWTDDDAALRAHLQDANIPALMASLVHITGDMSPVRGAIRPLTAPLAESEDDLTEDQRQEVLEQAFHALRDYRDRGCTLPPPPSDDDIKEMITFLTGLPVPEGYMPILEEELALNGARARTVPVGTGRADARPGTFKVLIIGAGMSGLLAAIKLKEAGIPWEIVDKNEKIGGTWWENTYPGCRVDSPNHLYSYVFDRKDDWPGYFSTRETLFEYFNGVVERYGLADNISLGAAVREATFDEASALWHVTIDGPEGPQTRTANAVITAVGQLNIPKMPDIPGLEKFSGVKFHSAAWEHEHDLTGKRVAVIGTGASATQFVPEIAPDVGQMYVFQRSAPWLLPTPDYHEDVPAGQLWLFHNVPYYANWYRCWVFRRDAADGALPFLYADEGWNDRSKSVGADNEELRQTLIDYIDEQLEDHPELRENSIPDYPPGGKRPLRDCGVWFDALKQDHVELITDPIAEITETGLRTQSGAEYAVDVLICGTGFHADHFLWPMEFTGLGGKKLSAQWAERPQAYKGISVPNFPNLFCLYGPNTNIVVGSSIIFYSECEMRYIMGCLKLLIEDGHAAMHCRQDVHDAYNQRIDAENAERAWGAPGVRSWYKNADGKVTQNWPGTHLEFWRETYSPDPADYEFL